MRGQFIRRDKAASFIERIYLISNAMINATIINQLRNSCKLRLAHDDTPERELEF